LCFVPAARFEEPAAARKRSRPAATGTGKPVAYDNDGPITEHIPCLGKLLSIKPSPRVRNLFKLHKAGTRMTQAQFQKFRRIAALCDKLSEELIDVEE
jgi:hypothetical protein